MDFPFPHQKGKLLSTLSTIGIGGPANYYVEARQIQDLKAVVTFCSDHQLPFFILGKGSNCLFDDSGFFGVVIHNKIDFLERPKPSIFRVGAGYSFSLLGVQTAREGWSGLEFASGIPASVGGAVFMNAGANGREVCETVVGVDFMDAQGHLHHFSREDLRFAYRFSSFQEMKGAIISVDFELTPASDARQKQLEILQYRTKTQPYGEKSAGCVFRNPDCGSAGALIDQSGLKGFSISDAKVSSLHANFIVNTGQAKAKDVLALMEHIKKEVFQKKGIELESEVRYISNFSKNIFEINT